MVYTFNSDMSDGVMSGMKTLYKDKSISEIKEELLKSRRILGEKIGIDGTKIIVPYQDLTKHKSGHYEDMTDSIEYIMSENKDVDLWNFDVPCDIMLIRSRLEGVALAYPVADCPVIVASTNNVLALAHCGLREINRYLPSMVIDAVRSVSKNNEEVKVSVSPCASSKTYIYEKYPYFLGDAYKNAIKEEKDGYHINMKYAIMVQLIDNKVLDVRFSKKDTISDNTLYSNYAYRHGHEEKQGRFLSGAYFKKYR